MKETIQDNSPTTTNSAADTAPVAPPKRLLVVEGDGFTRLLLFLWLRTVGFRVDVTSNGQLGEMKLEATKPDALILDLKLRALTGLELIQRARKSEFGDRPIYIFTQEGQIHRRVRKELAGYNVMIFDRDAMSVEKFVAHVLSQMVPVEPTVEEMVASDSLHNESVLAPERSVELTVKQALAEVRGQTEMILSSVETKTRLAGCGVLCGKVATFAARAAESGLQSAVRQARVLEAMLKQLYKEPAQLTQSVLETISESVRVLEVLERKGSETESSRRPFSTVLITDGGKFAAGEAEHLKMAGLELVVHKDPASGRAYLESKDVDLIINRVPMPELHGLDEKNIHNLPHNKKTPVILLPRSEGAFESDRNSGTELNPVTLMECILKTLNAKEQPKAVPAEFSLTSEEAKLSVEAEMAQDPATQSKEQVSLPEGLVTDTSTASGKDAQNGGTILFVEDDPFVLKFYRRPLKAAGFKIVAVEDGDAAIMKLGEMKPDVVVLDLMLHKVHGIEVLKFMRSQEALKEIPVLVLSTAYMDLVAARVLEAGATMGILKTECTPPKLIELVHELLGRTHGEVALPEEVAAHAVDPGANGETAIWLRENDPKLKAPRDIKKIRETCREYVKNAGLEKSYDYLEELYRLVRFLSARSALAGLTKIAEVASALEALLFDLVSRTATSTPSTLQSIAQAVDCLETLIRNGDTTFEPGRSRPRVLVVDDDQVCTFTTVGVLKRARFEPVGAHDPKEALRLLEESKFNLVMLDINMPELNGFQVCEQLRRMPQHKTCPVMFVTLSSEFQTRARSVLAGGNDLLTKPVNPMELVLKATVHIVNSSPHHAAARFKLSQASEDSIASMAIDRVEQIQPEQSSDRVLAVEVTGPEETTSLVAKSDRVVESETNALAAGENAAPTIENAQSEEGMVAEATGPESELTWTAVTTENRVHAEPGSLAQESTQEGKVSPASDVPTDHGILPPTAPEPPTELDQLRAELARHREAVEKQSQERQTFIDRIYTAENNLCREQSRVKRREKMIENLTKELEEFKTKSGDEAARALAGEVEQIQKQAEERCQKLEQELAVLKKAREELTHQFTTEQEASAKSAGQMKALEQRLEQKAAELEKARAEAETRAKEHQDAETGLRRELEQANNGHKQAQERCQQLEHELAGLNKAREELTSRFTVEQEASAKSARQIKDLEQQLEQRTAELEKARAEAEARAKEHQDAESGLRRELEQATNEHKQAQEWCRELEQELERLNQAREELTTRFTVEQQTSGKSAEKIKNLEQELHQRTAELEKSRAEAETRAKEHQDAESALRQELEKAASEHKHTQERCQQLEQELSGLKEAREELTSKFSVEQQTSAKSAQQIKQLEEQLQQRTAELEKSNARAEARAKEHQDAEAAVRQELEKARSGHKQAQARCDRLEQELSALTKAREELTGKFGVEQEASAKSAQQIKELEKHLQQRTAELEKARADAEARAKEHQATEAGLHGELEKASQGQKQAQERCRELEQELRRLSKAREELDTQFTYQKQASAKAAELMGELEQRLEQLINSNTAAEARTREHQEAEAALRRQLEQATDGHKQAQQRCQQLAQELTGLLKAREELDTQFTVQRQANAKSAEQIKQLEARVEELRKAKTAAEAQTKAHEDAEARLRRDLDKSTASHKEAEDRCRKFEQELTALNKAHQELTSKFAVEHQTTAKSGRQIKELEQELEHRTAELKKARAEAESQAKEHQSAETGLRRQLKQFKASHKQAQDRCEQLEQELAALNKAHSELANTLAAEQKTSARSARQISELQQQLEQRTAELEQARVDAKEHQSAEAGLRQDLEQSRTAQQQSQARCGQLEQELAGLSKAREELTSRFAVEQQTSAKSARHIKALEQELALRSAELNKAQAEAEARAIEHQNAETGLRRQLEQSTTGHNQAQERCRQLEQELTGLNKAREELAARFTTEQQTAAESAKRIRNLEEQLAQDAAELERVKAELQSRSRQHELAVQDLRRQLSETGAGHQQAQSQVARLTQDFQSLQQAHSAVNEKLTAEQQAGVASAERIKELAIQLTTKSAELANTRTELEKLADIHKRMQADLGQKLEEAGINRQQAESRAARLDQDLSGLRETHGQLTAKWNAEQRQGVQLRAQVHDLERELQAARAEQARQEIELEQRITQGVSALARVTADLARESGERQRSDERAAALTAQLQQLHAESGRILQAHHASQERIAEVEAQLREREDTIARKTAELEQQKGEVQLAQEQLLQARDANARFRSDLVFFEQANRTLNATRDELQARLQVNMSLQQQTAEQLQAESAERQRLAAALEVTQHDVQEQNRKREQLEAELLATRNELRDQESRFQQETAERHRLSADLDGTRRELQNQTRRREQLEAELQATTAELQQRLAQWQVENAERQRLASSLDKMEAEVREQGRKTQNLEGELRALSQNLHERETRLADASAEIQNLRQKLESVQLELNTRSESAQIDRSRLESALEIERVERRRQEAQFARLRHLTLDANRGARSFRNTLRRQVLEPLDALQFSARTLLQSEMEEPQKKIAEAILENTLLVHTRLQDPEFVEVKPPGQEISETAGEQAT